MTDEIRNKDDAKGRLKEAAGDLTGDDELQREGKVDQATGTVKDGVEKGKNEDHGAGGKDKKRNESAKEDIFERAAECVCAGAVLRTDVAAEAAHDCGRHAVVLDADQVGGGGDLVGDRDHGCRQLPAIGVFPASP